jgi:hypothetical protein
MSAQHEKRNPENYSHKNAINNTELKQLYCGPAYAGKREFSFTTPYY